MDRTPNPQITTELIPREEAMAELRMGKTTFFRKVNAGEIAVVHHCNRLYVSRQEIDDYWAKRVSEGKKTRARRARSNPAAVDA